MPAMGLGPGKSGECLPRPANGNAFVVVDAAALVAFDVAEPVCRCRLDGVPDVLIRRHQEFTDFAAVVQR